MSSLPSQFNARLVAGLLGVFLLMLFLPEIHTTKGLANYLPLHSALETASLAMTIMVFAVVWHSWESGGRRNHLFLLGCLFSGVALLDFLHTLSYKGMPDFITPGSPDKAILFWFAARYLAAFALLLAALQLSGRVAAPRGRRGWLTLTLLYVLLTSVIFLWFSDLMPRMFIEGQGLTRLKIELEYLLIALLAGVVWIFLSLPAHARTEDTRLLTTAALVTMLSELCFTLYTNVNDLFNVLGHVYKVIAYYFVYRAAFVLNIHEPFHRVHETAQALAESEQRYRTLFDNSPDGILIADLAHQRLAYANPVIAEMLGYAPSELLNAHISSIHPPEDFPRLAETFRTMAQTSRGQVQDIPCLSKDGQVIYTDIGTSTIQFEGVPAMIGFLRDATERRSMQSKLEEWSRVFNAAAFDMGIGDALDNTFVTVNPSFAQRRGYTVEELAGQPFSLIYPPDVLPSLMGFIQQVDISGHGVTETEHITKDGRRFPVMLDVTSMQSPGEAVKRRMVLALDISDRKAAEARLIEHQNQLEALVARRTAQLAEAKDIAVAASQAKSAFLANMSHEIRTPLNAITGMAHLMRRAGLDAEQSERLDKLENASRHLLQVINDILDLSKIEAGKFTLESAPLDVASIIDATATLILDNVQAKGLTLVREIEAMPAGLVGDRTRLQQALLNYASNAVKFTERGKITLRARLIESADDHVVLRLEVEDTGIGMPPATLDRLFHAFEQADNSTTRRYGGTGLGLVITRRIAELMDGSAGAESTEGQGSTFWIEVRLVRDASAILQVEQDSLETLTETLRSRCTGKRILLAEDEPVNREIALDLLETCGLTAECAENGAVAVELAAQRPYDLILMDMQMPRLDGLDATRQIRALPNGSAVPIIAMTANAFAEDRLRCMEAGMNDFLAKPVLPELLYRALFKWLAPAKG